MKKILIVSYYYKHKNAMASIRAIKLAKYFSKLGYEVTVLTSLQRDTWTKSYENPIKSDDIREIYAPELFRWKCVIDYINKRRKKRIDKVKEENHENHYDLKDSRKLKLKRKFIKYLKWLYYFNLAKYEDKCMYKGLKKEFKRQKLQKFEYVICTYPTYGAFMMGIWLKKNDYCKYLVADFRDPLYNPSFRSRKAELNYDKKCMKKIINYSDFVVGVSQGIIDGITENVNKKIKVKVITNGFDSDDVPENTKVAIESEEKNIKHFVYTGAMYGNQRDIKPFFKILNELINDKLIDKTKIKIHYAGNDFLELESQAKIFGLENIVVNHGFVSREKSLSLQQSADGLILLTWNNQNYQGVIPGKLFEYMSYETIPIIALVSGNKANSEVKNIVNSAKCGVVYEESDESSYSELKQYIVDIVNGNLKFHSQTKQYNYEQISKKYIEFILKEER